MESNLFPEKAILQNGTRQYKFSPPEYKMGIQSDYNISCEENKFVSQNSVFNHFTSYNFLEGQTHLNKEEIISRY